MSENLKKLPLYLHDYNIVPWLRELLAEIIKEKEKYRNCAYDVVTMPERGVHLDSVTLLLVIS